MECSLLLAPTFLTPVWGNFSSSPQAEEGFDPASRWLKGAFLKATVQFGKVVTRKNRALAKEIIRLLRACSYDVVCPKEGKAFLASDLIFVLRPHVKDSAFANGAFSKPMVPFKNLVLPFAEDVRSFYIPVSGQTRVLVDTENKKIVPYGPGLKGIRKALRLGVEPPRSLLLEGQKLADIVKEEFPVGINLKRDARRIDFPRCVRRRNGPFGASGPGYTVSSPPSGSA